MGIIVYGEPMLSQKSHYALRALLVLAARGDGKPIQIAEIADSANIPKKFLEQILLELKKPGIVRSHRGRSGGYSLGRPAKDISFADVLRVTDGPLALTPCGAKVITASIRPFCRTARAVPIGVVGL